MFATEEYQAPIKSIVAGIHAAGASQGVVNAMLAKYFEIAAASKAGQLRLDPEYI